MKQIFLIALVALAFASCQQNSKKSTDQSSNVPVTSSNAPSITFEKASYDFGKITQGEKVFYSYKFKNTGKTPLIITNATATCGCTIPEIPKEPVKPGAEGEIKVVFDSTGKSGLQDKVVTIISNAAQSTVQVHLKGEVKG